MSGKYYCLNNTKSNAAIEISDTGTDSRRKLWIIILGPDYHTAIGARALGKKFRGNTKISLQCYVLYL